MGVCKSSHYMLLCDKLEPIINDFYGPGVVNDRAIFTLRFVETQPCDHRRVSNLFSACLIQESISLPCCHSLVLSFISLSISDRRSPEHTIALFSNDSISSIKQSTSVFSIS